MLDRVGEVQGFVEVLRLRPRNRCRRNQITRLDLNFGSTDVGLIRSDGRSDSGGNGGMEGVCHGMRDSFGRNAQARACFRSLLLRRQRSFLSLHVGGAGITEG